MTDYLKKIWLNLKRIQQYSKGAGYEILPFSTVNLAEVCETRLGLDLSPLSHILLMIVLFLLALMAITLWYKFFLLKKTEPSFDNPNTSQLS